MQRFLNIDNQILQQLEKLIAYFPEYDLRGWIKESIEELIKFEERIKKFDLSPFKSSYSRLGFSFEAKFWEKLDQSVRRLKALKSYVSRNVLVNQAIVRKMVELQKNVNFIQKTENFDFFYQQKLPIKGTKIKLDLRVPLKIFENLKRCVKQRKVKNIRFSINDWLNEAVRHFLFEEGKKTSPICGLNKNSLENNKRTAIYLDREILKEIDSMVSLRKKTIKGFSRTSWFQEATNFYLSHSIIK